MIEQKLSGKIAVITGGNSGIGLASAKLFRSQGATVVIVGRDAKTLAQACAEIGGNTASIQADVSTLEAIEQVTEKVKDQFGKIDILFANAGISHCPPIAETEEEDFDRIMNINVKGVFFLFKFALPLLSEGASVIFTCSVSHDRGRPGDPLYAASKAAVRSLARTLAADEEVLARKIRVNVVSPGAVQTPLTQQESAEAVQAINDYIESVVPMARWGHADEIAKAALFLASSDSSYMTGAELAVDGGLAQI